MLLNTIMISNCKEKEYNTVAIKGDNIIAPVLFGVALGFLIVKSLN
ncbi:hypothetical protein [uncultured Tenacibaculum sp.]|nr:hypothetical protein [uncultured Tenacibaculum sp.]